MRRVAVGLTTLLLAGGGVWILRIATGGLGGAPTPAAPQASPASSVAPGLPPAPSFPPAAQGAPAAPAAPAAPTAAATLPVTLPGTADLSATGSTLWALMNGQFLFRSLNQGTTWEQRRLPRDDRGYVGGSFISVNEGWLLSAGPPATQCMGQSIALCHTADAGATWETLPATGIEFRQCKSSPSFVDARQGFLTAGDPNSPPVIYRTDDGAVNWQPSAPLPDPPGVTTSGVGFTLRAQRVQALGSRAALHQLRREWRWRRRRRSW